MRLLSFRHREREGFGVLVGDDQLAELTSKRWPNLKMALATATSDELRKAALDTQTLIALTQIEYLPPVTDPEKIICVGFNYHTHGAETGNEIPEHPSLFVRFPSSQVGHLEPVVRPFHSEMFDFEGEIAVIIGRGGRHIARDDALDHVAGYSCFAENSVRDFQRHSRQATAGKNFARSGAFGPFIVTADEIPDPSALTLITRLNGIDVQRASAGDLVFPVQHLISYVSAFTRIEPGDVIVTGTPSGVGSARKPPLWMKAGDVLEVEVSGIGVLRNPVIDERPAS